MAKEASLRLIVDSLNASGESPEKTLDEVLDLAGYTGITPGRRLSLAAVAADQAVTFVGAIGLIIISHDNFFKLRLATGETLMTNLRLFVAWASDEDTALASTVNVLLTGNGTTTADIEIWIIEKP